MLTLPLIRMMAAATATAAGIGALGWLVVQILGPANPGPAVLGVWLGAAAVAAAHASGLVAMRPWRARHLGRWPFAWLLGRAVSFGVVVVVAVLLYSATQPNLVAFGLVIALGYFAALMAEVAVYAAHVRSLPES